MAWINEQAPLATWSQQLAEATTTLTDTTVYVSTNPDAFAQEVVQNAMLHNHILTAVVVAVHQVQQQLNGFMMNQNAMGPAQGAARKSLGESHCLIMNHEDAGSRQLSSKFGTKSSLMHWRKYLDPTGAHS